MIYILVSLLCSTASFADSPIREGLGFKAESAPLFDDTQLLSSIQSAVEDSNVAPVTGIKIDAGRSKVGIAVVGEKNQARSFTFRIEDGKAVGYPGAIAEKVNHQVEVPFGTLKMYGFEQKHGFDYSGTASWVAVGVVGVYAAKKVLNKMTIGKWSAGEEHDHSLFPDAKEMREELTENRELLAHALAKVEDALDGQLLAIVKPLAQVAACGHNHGLGEKASHGTGFVCEGIDEPKIQAARQSLLTGFPSYAKRFGNDIYNELISPVVGLVKAVFDKGKRTQTWNFFDLISRRLMKERGMTAAVVTMVYVGTTQAAWETVESFIMPAGLHLYCTIANTAILASAMNAYTTYFCMTQHQEFKDKTIVDRWRVAQKMTKLTKPNAEPKEENEKITHALNLLFRLVERDVRHARNLGDLAKPESRILAERLGTLRRELSVLSIRLINKTAADHETLNWLKALYEVQSVVQDCQLDLESAA